MMGMKDTHDGTQRGNPKNKEDNFIAVPRSLEFEEEHFQ